MLPLFKSAKRTFNRSQIQMKSICYTEFADVGAVKDSAGITAAASPYIKTLPPRLKLDEEVSDISEWNGLVKIKGGIVYYADEPIGNVTSGKKQFAVVNSKLCIFPDKVYIDLTNSTTGKLDAEVSSITDGASVSGKKVLTMTTDTVKGSATFTGEGRQGLRMPWVNKYSSITVSGGQVIKSGRTPIPLALLSSGDILCPSVSAVGAYSVAMVNGQWCASMEDYEDIDPDDYPDIPTEDEATDGTFAQVTSNSSTINPMGKQTTTTQCTIKSTVDISFTTKFKVGDRLTVFKGSTVYCDKAIVRAITANTLTFDDNTFSGSDRTLSGITTVKREVPDLDFICESENRLWGCHGNTIYASALGDPTHFYDYGTETTSSYAVAVGSENPFTACAKYSSAVVFFKRNMIHKVLGDYPSNYTMYSSVAEGVKDGCERSLVTINNVLYYYGIHGVYAYTGGTPSLISSNFGEMEFSEASGGTDGRSYYLSAKIGNKSYAFAYDLHNGVWTKHGDILIGRYVMVGGTLCYLEDDVLYQANGGTGEVEWYVEFHPFNDIRNDITMYIHKARYEKLILHLDMPKSSHVVVYVGENRLTEVARIHGSDNVITVPLPVNRCEHYSLRLEGKGECSIKSITREFEQRSER